MFFVILKKKTVFHFKPSEVSFTGIMCLESQNSRIPNLFLDPRNLVSQKYCDPNMVTPWCHHGRTKREKGMLPGAKPGPTGKRKKRPNPKWSPDLTGQCHRAAHARTRRNDFSVGGPGGLTPPTSDLLSLRMRRLGAKKLKSKHSK